MKPCKGILLSLNDLANPNQTLENRTKKLLTDENTRTPLAICTRTAGDRAPQRRALKGTPLDEGPCMHHHVLRPLNNFNNTFASSYTLSAIFHAAAGNAWTRRAVSSISRVPAQNHTVKRPIETLDASMFTKNISGRSHRKDLSRCVISLPLSSCDLFCSKQLMSAE